MLLNNYSQSLELERQLNFDELLLNNRQNFDISGP